MLLPPWQLPAESEPQPNLPLKLLQTFARKRLKQDFFSYYEQSSVLKESELEAGNSGALGTAGDNCQAPRTAMGCLQVM